MTRARDVADVLSAASALATDVETAAAILVAVPPQSSNTGKYLTTNGSATSWAAVVAGAAFSELLLIGA